MKTILISISALILAFNMNTMAETELKEKVSQKPGEILIPYEKYVLDNGLTLIIHEDHSDPVVHVDVTYHVGSAREEIGKSGFAHFFEHMMFQGSENVGDEEHFQIVTESGGTLNGSTNRDRTNYFETLPSNQLEVGLWLEADRMGFLLDAVTQEKFEIQRSTVKNERGQNYDNRPYGLASEYTSKTLYPYGHPYSWLTIGYVEDLDRVDVNDLKKFFMRWYGPNNAVLTVGGDVNPKEVVALVEKYYGSIKRGPEVKNMDKMIPKLERDRYVSYEDQIRFPMLQMTWPTAPVYSADEAAIDCFSNIIGGGQTSILFKNLVKNQKALQAVAYQPCFELSGEFTIQVLANFGGNLKDIQDVVRASLEEFEERGVTKEDVEKYIAQQESSTIYGLSTVRGKVSQLAQYATLAGTPNYIQKDLQRYKDLTPDAVMAAYNKYIKGKASVILSVYPEKGQDLIAADNNFEVSTKGYKSPDYGYKGLTFQKSKDKFDRSIKPAAGKNPIVNVPEVWTANFDNGMKVIGTNSSEIPTVNLLLTIEGGHRLEAYKPGQAGISMLMASMMNESTQARTAEEMAQALELLGSSVSVRSSADNISVSIQTLTKNLEATLELANEIMMKPGFNEEDFERLKKQQMEAIQNQNTQAGAIANKVFDKLIYGVKNIQGIPEMGTLETMEEIQLKDVKEFYKNYFSPNKSNLVIVGDISEDEVLTYLDFLREWNGPEVKIPENMKVISQESKTIYLVNKEKSAQSEIRIGRYTGIKYEPLGLYYKAYLDNYNLGGAFNSRINLNLREDKGYTYGARSRFDSDDFGGVFVASAGVKLDASAASVKEFMKEINDYYQKGITDAEITFMQKSIGQREALSYESPFQKASFLRRIVKYDLETNYTAMQNEILQGISKKELDEISSKYLNTNDMIILVVGDEEVILKELQAIGYPVVLLDMEGNIKEELPKSIQPTQKVFQEKFTE